MFNTKLKVVIRPKVCCRLFWVKNWLHRGHPFNNDCVHLSHQSQPATVATCFLQASLFSLSQLYPILEKGRLEGDKALSSLDWHSTIKFIQRLSMLVLPRCGRLSRGVVLSDAKHSRRHTVGKQQDKGRRLKTGSAVTQLSVAYSPLPFYPFWTAGRATRRQNKPQEREAKPDEL